MFIFTYLTTSPSKPIILFKKHSEGSRGDLKIQRENDTGPKTQIETNTVKYKYSRISKLTVSHTFS